MPPKAAKRPSTATPPRSKRSKTAPADKGSGDIGELFRKVKADLAPVEKAKKPAEPDVIEPAEPVVEPAVAEKAEEAPAADASLTDEEDTLLRSFDLDQKFGPCVGLSRKERWERAESFGLEPPAKVWSLLSTLRDESPHNANACLSKYPGVF
tara:strand:+ start:1652 stop:2110 length:459 start_codon:yes stop_codon:yes gene_type:complete